MHHIPCRAAVAAALLLHAVAGAQTAAVFTRPWLEWRTLRTEHFEVHFPREAERWALDVASRLEPAHARVSALVGHRPERRIRIIVEDPAGASNGSAFAFLDRPTVSLWPTPPDPRTNIGHTRSPSEQLLLHELAHIAHLSRPSRNRLERLAAAVLPVRVGPIDRAAPRWLTEGYATWVEGRLTGSGRPHGALRAALLRQWALEGRLPSYRSLGNAGGFYGPTMAYMAGSAFLEWLTEAAGEETLPRLWEAMSGAERLSFEEAFQRVYGKRPESLYGVFAADLTERAVEVRSRLREAGGTVLGDTLRRLAWGTGDPALSRDGSKVAVVLRGAPGTPSRVVIWRTAEVPLLPRPEPPLAAPHGRASRARTAVAELFPVEGRAHDAPRFLPDGRLLVVRAEPLEGGASRGDLFVWEPRSGELRRVTRGAGIRGADPSPNGRIAAAVRCAGGICDLVRVDLASGETSVIAAGTTEELFHRPRWSPSGDRLLVAVLRRGQWRPAVVDPLDGRVTLVGPEDGNDRYDAAWAADGRRVVVTSEAGGIANLEVIDLASGSTRPLTRATGAAVGAELDPRSGAVYFLSLHAGGLDLHRIHPDSAWPAAVSLPGGLAPALPPAAAGAAADTLPREPVPPAVPYGLGPRSTRVLPIGVAGAGGLSGGAMVSNTDPVGRLALLLRATGGGSGIPGGLSGTVEWRGGARPLIADAWWTALAAGAYGGVGLRTRWARRLHGVRSSASVGASAGVLDGAGRVLGWLDAAAEAGRRSPGGRVASGVRLRSAAGGTGGSRWASASVGASGGIALGPLGMRAEASHALLSPGAPERERFSAGGAPHPHLEPATVPQRIPMPALGEGTLTGSRLTSWRLSGSYRAMRPYLWGAATELGSVQVAGVEWELGLPPSNVLALPGMQFSAGAGAPLSGEGEGRLQAYFAVGYRF